MLCVKILLQNFWIGQGNYCWLFKPQMFIMANDMQAFAKRSVKILKRFTIILTLTSTSMHEWLRREVFKSSCKNFFLISVYKFLPLNLRPLKQMYSLNWFYWLSHSYDHIRYSFVICIFLTDIIQNVITKKR